MDPLSQVLSLLKIRSVLSARFEGYGEWAMCFPAYRHIKFGGVLEGSFKLWSEGSSVPVDLEAGDFYLLTDGSPYCSATTLERKPVDGKLIFETHRGADGKVRYGRSGKKVVVAGGRFTFDDASSDLLLQQLPAVIHIPSASDIAAPLKAVLGLLATETETVRPGFDVSAASIANIVLVQILRAYVATGPQPPGWLSAIGDARIGNALKLMHDDLTRRWTVEELAVAAGMSRTAFNQRFKILVGSPPLHYLLHWRMTVARDELRKGGSLSRIAEAVGYSSDTAFNSAFKRITGKSPGQYRLQEQVRESATELFAESEKSSN